MEKPMPIPAVTSLLCKCYNAAEQSTREQLATDYLDKGEEFITELFHGRLRAAVRAANEKDRIKDAFLEDLRGRFPTLHSGDLDRIARGIRASTTLHPREVERETGGDLGIVLIRPSVSESRYDPSRLKINRDYQRGLLCQAKLKRRPRGSQEAQWGSFTANQKQVLPPHTSYLSLILYEYEDAERHSLSPFQWQLCNGGTIDKIEDWLKTAMFPHLRTSGEIIELLGKDQIGTDKKEIIQQYIGPAVRPTLISGH